VDQEEAVRKRSEAYTDHLRGPIWHLNIASSAVIIGRELNIKPTPTEEAGRQGAPRTSYPVRSSC
jgi:hypothetical protein